MSRPLFSLSLLLVAGAAAVASPTESIVLQAPLPVPAAPVLSSSATTPQSAATPARATASVAGLDREHLLEALAADLTAHYALADTLAVDLVRSWAAPVAVETGSPVTVSVIEYPEVLAPSMLVRLRYLQGKSILREDTLALRVSLWRDVMVSAIPLNRGDSLTLQVIETRRVDALRDRDSLSISVAGADYVFSRAIPAGRPLTWRDVMRRSLVQKGQMVEVLASDGSLVISMKALAMQDGAKGDAVRVRNVESKREFIAKVTAENRAEVRF